MSGRPKIYEDLKNTTLSLEREIIERCKEMGINISEVCRSALLNIINDPILTKKYSKFDRIPNETKKLVLDVIRKHPQNVEGCLKILKRQTGLNFGSLEFLQWVDSQEDEK